MNMNINAGERIGDIVTRLPKAAEIFKRYRIDFCCGGNRPLGEAIFELKLNEEEVLVALEKVYAEIKENSDKKIDWSSEPFTKLIDHIINKHHSYVQSEMPIISEYVSKILRVHGSNHGELSKVHKLFNSLRTELEQHLIKEEEVVFPLIVEYEKDKSEEALLRALSIIEELEQEHEGAGDILKELRKITEDYNIPADVCRTFALTYKMLEEFESDLFEHVHLENNILFPSVKSLKK